MTFVTEKVIMCLLYKLQDIYLFDFLRVKVNVRLLHNVFDHSLCQLL